MKLNEPPERKARPDQVRMSHSVHIVTERHRSASGALILIGLLVIASALIMGVIFGGDLIGAYLGTAGRSPVPSALAAETATVTEKATSPASSATLTVTPTLETKRPSPAAEPARTQPIIEATEKAITATAIFTEVPITATVSITETPAAATATPTEVPPTATPSPTPTPEDTPTLTAAESEKATAIAPDVATAVVATLTAMPTQTSSPTPDQMATATAVAGKIATAVAATLTVMPVGPTITGEVETPAAAITATVTVTATMPVTPGGCLNDAAYLADVTIPDRTELAPGATFTKTWAVRNVGSCDWEPGYKLIYARYEQLSGPAEVVISDTIPAGGSMEISVPLVAPTKPGEYTSVWQLTDLEGIPFGEVLTALIVVPGAGDTDLLLPNVPPAKVEFGYGIQAHIWDGDLEPVVSAVLNMGFGWVKQQTEWRVMEPENGNYQWGNTDRIVAALTTHGLKPMFSVVKSPEWARPSTTDFNVEGPPSDPKEFAEFLGAMAARYKGRVKAYEVWNEQNLHYEWGNEQLDPARYVTLLKLAYVAIKTSDPEAVVISGALTPTGAPPPWAIDDYQYLEGMYQNGLKEACDAIGAHPSGYNMPPDVDWQTWSQPGLVFQGPVNNRHHSWSFKATMEGYRNIMLKYDDGGKTVWPTEFGWASSGLPSANYEYAADNSLEQQATYTVKAYQMGKSWGWVGVMFLWNLNFKVVSPGSEQAQWGIVEESWSPLPVYNALAAMPK